jgi:hypothetical protein
MSSVASFNVCESHAKNSRRQRNEQPRPFLVALLGALDLTATA